MCFAVPEKEVEAVAEALQSRFRQALDAGRLSQVLHFYKIELWLMIKWLDIIYDKLCLWVILSALVLGI